jgi:hypothetical protein
VKFNHTAHKALWNWLAENPDKNKEHWPGWWANGGQYHIVRLECFSCEVCNVKCSLCPLIWPDKLEDYQICGNDGSLFNRWYKEKTNASLRTELALQIANLPVREGVECE